MHAEGTSLRVQVSRGEVENDAEHREWNVLVLYFVACQIYDVYEILCVVEIVFSEAAVVE